MEIIELGFIGLTQGCIYGLIALGFVLIYKATEMINFSQGDLAVLGAFTAISLVENNYPFFLSIGITLLFMFAVGFLLEVTLIRKLHGQPQFAVIILTISLGLVIRALIGAIWGYEPKSLTLPLPESSLDLSPIVLMITTIALCTAIVLFFRTKTGLAIKAASQNQLAAFYLGIPVKTIFSISWGVGSLVASVGGILLASHVLIDPHTGFIGIKAFAAAVIGGLGSLPGAMLGGILVGVVEQLAGAFLPPGSQEIAAYVMMILVLYLKPHGIISQIQLKKA